MSFCSRSSSQNLPTTLPTMPLNCRHFSSLAEQKWSALHPGQQGETSLVSKQSPAVCKLMRKWRHLIYDYKSVDDFPVQATVCPASSIRSNQHILPCSILMSKYGHFWHQKSKMATTVTSNSKIPVSLLFKFKLGRTRDVFLLFFSLIWSCCWHYPQCHPAADPLIFYHSQICRHFLFKQVGGAHLYNSTWVFNYFSPHPPAA